MVIMHSRSCVSEDFPGFQGDDGELYRDINRVL